MNYGNCCECGEELKPVWFTDKEFVKGIWTGRVKTACSHLVCDMCGHNEAVDGSFDGPWHRKSY